MKTTVQKIRFNGLDFILTTPKDDNSPITTIKDYQAGRCSYAHFYREANNISRYGNRIGGMEDIEFGEMVEIEIDVAEAIAGFVGDSWPF